MSGYNGQKVGDVIKRLRVQTLNETPAQFSKRFGVSRRTINQWESNRKAPSDVNWELLKQLLPKMMVTNPDELRQASTAPPPPARWGKHEVLELCRMLSVSTRGLAKELDLDPGTTSAWAAGTSAPTRHSIIRQLNDAWNQVHASAKTPDKEPEDTNLPPLKEMVQFLRSRYGETNQQFGQRFGVGNSQVSNWASSGVIADKHRKKIINLYRRAVAPATPAPAPKEHAAPTTPAHKVAVEPLLETVQQFKERRGKALVEEALAHAAAQDGVPKHTARRMIATFLYLVYEEVPLNVILSELTGHSA